MEIGNEIKFNYSDDISHHWELLLDNIGGGRGREGIIGDKAAPKSAATEIILVYQEGEGGCVL